MQENRFHLFDNKDYKDYIYYRALYVKGKKYVEPLVVIQRLKSNELIHFLDENVEEIRLKLESGRRQEVLALNYHKLYSLDLTSPFNIFKVMKKSLKFNHSAKKAPYLIYSKAVEVLKYMEYVLNRYPVLTKERIKQIIKNVNRKINE